MFRATLEVMLELQQKEIPAYMKPPALLTDQELDELYEYMLEAEKEPVLTKEQEMELFNKSPHKAALDQCVQKIIKGLEQRKLRGQFVEDTYFVQFEAGPLTREKIEFLLTIRHGEVGVVTSLIMQKQYDWAMIDTFGELIVFEQTEGVKYGWDAEYGKPLVRMVITDAYEDEKIKNASRWVNDFVTLYTAKMIEADAKIQNYRLS